MAYRTRFNLAHRFVRSVANGASNGESANEVNATTGDDGDHVGWLAEPLVDDFGNRSTRLGVDATTTVPGYINGMMLAGDGNDSAAPFERTFFDNNFENTSYNFTLCDLGNETCWNMTNGTEPFDEVTLQEPLNFWALILLFFPITTVFGNILVVLSVYRERTLQTVTNYFIVSLAIADILVAMLVMPLAIYFEINNYKWDLSPILCDAWVCFDVLCCTASILNLVAISVDRFYAVTQPIKYAKHKNSNRVYIMLALTWIVSIAIACPIVLGMNQSPKRAPRECGFFNTDFLIYSSMASFYIPTVLMIVLYYRIFKTIHERAKRQRAAKNKAKTYENKTATRLADTGKLKTDTNHQNAATLSLPSPSQSFMRHPEEISNVATTDTHSEDEDQDGHIRVDSSHVIVNDKSSEFMMNPVAVATIDCPRPSKSELEAGYSAPSAIVETKFTHSPIAHKHHIFKFPGRKPKQYSGRNGATKDTEVNLTNAKRSVTKFHFHLPKKRKHQKKKDRSATKRERKATKTLAIVLGVFLICWWPFFIVNNLLIAFCTKFDSQLDACNIEIRIIIFLTWMGYINSFLNPIIYTIFNVEFRKAFHKIVTNPCNTRNR